MQLKPLIFLGLAIIFLIVGIIVLALYAGHVLQNDSKSSSLMSPAWGSWEDSSICSSSCGLGQKTQKRKCENTFPTNKGSECQGPASQYVDCNAEIQCPIDGNWGSWEDTSNCSSTCGNGQKLQERQCDNPAPANYGNYCPDSSYQYVACSNDIECPISGNWGNWEDSTNCSSSCGKGQKLQVRLCDNPPPENNGSDCQGPLSQFVDCNEEIQCQINGNWGSWEDSSDCSTTCEKGQKLQVRLCDNPPPENNGSDCQGPLSQFVDCNTEIQCPINGNWGNWEDSSVCSATCGNGEKVQVRQCNNPSPENNGSYCQGPVSQFVTCIAEIQCPVNGNWGSWKDTSVCSTTCGLGQKVQERQCNNPIPAYQGKFCEGSSIQNVDCSTGYICPVHGNWGSWEDTSDCSTSCGQGLKAQKRLCNNPIPKWNGNYCQGSSTQSVDCNSSIICPVHGNWGSWEDTSVCSASCGMGQKVQKRQCNNPAPAYQGNFCQGSSTQNVNCDSSIICPGDIDYGSWVDASACSSSCGRGQKVQTRTCTKPNDNNTCTGPSSQSVDCYYGIPCPNHTKALVIGGWTFNGNTDEVEVIDLTSSTTTCANVSNYPFPNRGTLGGLIDDSVPMVCGGNEPTVSNCNYYINNIWVEAPNLTISRGHGTGISLFPFGNSLQKFLVTGGETSITTEILDGQKWTTSNLPNFPAPPYVSCITFAHDSTLMLTGGLLSTSIGSTKTFIMNQTFSQWVPGPSLFTGRYGHSCGTILNDNSGMGLSVIAVGGLMKNSKDPTNTVEVLDKGSKAWRLGPSLPVSIASASLVTDRLGRVFLIGGLKAENALYRLPHAGKTAIWQIMGRLKTPRTWHFAFTIPDSIARCQ